jgi:hypothetical protein
MHVCEVRGMQTTHYVLIIHGYNLTATSSILIRAMGRASPAKTTNNYFLIILNKLMCKNNFIVNGYLLYVFHKITIYYIKSARMQPIMIYFSIYLWFQLCFCSLSSLPCSPTFWKNWHSLILKVYGLMPR